MTKATPAKRINIVAIKMVKEGSILYDVRQISTPSDAAGLGSKFLEDSDFKLVRFPSILVDDSGGGCSR